MAKASLQRMSIDELLKLRDDVGNVLNRKAEELEDQLARLGRETTPVRRGRGSALRGRKVPVKFRDKAGNTWAGRGAMPIWLRDRIKAGAKLRDFAVNKKVAPRKGRKKSRRRAKR
jgi:DNA-binding protein H-NS